MVHYNELIFCPGPWCSLDNYMYKDQACKLFNPLYQVFVEHIKHEEDLTYIFDDAYALARLVFLDNHPELHSSDYINSVIYSEEKVDIMPEYYYSSAVLLTLYALIKCRKRKSQVADMFADQIYKAVYNNIAPADSVGSFLDKKEWASKVSAVVEKIQAEGGIQIDLVASCISGRDWIQQICDDLYFFDDNDYFWTKDDCIRFIRLGQNVDQQTQIYNSMARKIYNVYQEAKRNGDEELISLMKSKLGINDDGRFYVAEFELPQFAVFNSYLTLGAIDYKDEDAPQNNIVPQNNVEKDIKRDIEIDFPDTTKNSQRNCVCNLAEGNLKQTDKNRYYLAYMFLNKAIGNTELSTEHCELIAFITGTNNAKSVQTAINRILGNQTQGGLSPQEKKIFKKIKEKYSLG